MPPFTRIAEEGGKKGRRRSGQTERRGDVTQTASPSFSLPLSAAWSMECADFPSSLPPSPSSLVAVVPFHWRNVRHHSNRSHFASRGTPDGRGREREEERRRGRREDAAADTFFTVLFYAKRDFRTIHSFFWPVSHPAGQRASKHPRERSARPHIMAVGASWFRAVRSVDI